MTARNVPRLGRGIGSLISAAALSPPDNHSPGSLPMESLQIVPLDRLEPNPYQPRTTIDEGALDELAASIRSDGLIQPIIARPRGDKLEIIAGERRWHAARKAGLQRVPVIVRHASDQQMLEVALIENIHRQDLNPIDRALAYARFCETFGLSAEQAAHRLGEDRSTVANYLRLLDLDDDLQQKVRDGLLSMGHARCLVGIASPRQRQDLANRVIAEGLSVRALERLIQQARREGTAPATPPQRRNASRPQVQAMEARLTRAVGTRVRIREGRRPGRGKIIIDYYNLDDFDRIVSLLGIKTSEGPDADDT